MKLNLCKYAGCSALTPNYYCAKHKALSDKRRAEHNKKAFQNAVRSNQNLYHTQRWRTLRASIIAKYKVCLVCGSSENLTVDHIIAPRGNEELFFNENNLQTLCKSCHRIKTAREIQERR